MIKRRKSLKNPRVMLHIEVWQRRQHFPRIIVQANGEPFIRFGLN